MSESRDGTTVITQCDEIRALVRRAQQHDQTVGVVMTMGALHEGHLSLLDAARKDCDITVTTIYVNPTQFLPGEDFEKYPRTLADDVTAISRCGGDYVFAPSNGEMYSPRFSTYVLPPKVAERFEGAHRPGHFRGVTTVVLKFLQVVPADIAYFGHKDYQQSLVIRRMVEDLQVGTSIRVCPTVREPDGLALSSRNRYLDDTERQNALGLYRALTRAQELVKRNELNASRLRHIMETILVESNISRIDYIGIVDPETLIDVETIDEPAIALLAAHVGTTRLIDNVLLAPIGTSFR
ncbi:MAG: pantoate--beta-alanine ligase [Pirellulaceae bacterium]|nr:pantoate--beta-alanine ligase [Planctomycetales bacterium]